MPVPAAVVAGRGRSAKIIMTHNLYKIVVVVLRLVALCLVLSPSLAALQLVVTGVELNRIILIPLVTSIVLGLVLWFFARAIGTVVTHGFDEN